MQIKGNKPAEGNGINLKIQGVAQPEQKNPSAVAKKTGVTDKVEISEKAKELMAAISQMPEIREDKIKALKEAIEAGNYNIDPKKIAGKILEEI